MITRYWEDFKVGEVEQIGGKRVDKEEVIAFAKQYDPQPFHVDEAAAKLSMYGGLIASGWHTIALVMRVLVESYLSHVAALVSPGIDELRWLKPVRPGDTLSLRSTVLESTPSAKQPNRGTVLFRWEILNQNGEVALSMLGRQLFLRRAPA